MARRFAPRRGWQAAEPATPPPEPNPGTGRKTVSEAVATQVLGPMKCRGSTSATTTNYAASQHPPPPSLSRPREDCEGCPVLAGFAIQVWTNPSAGVQIYIAVSASAAASPRRAAAARRAGSAQAGVYRPHCSSGRMAGALRSAWHVVASMRPIHQKVSAPCDSARLSTRCHAPCQAGRRSRPRLRRRQCPKRPVRQLQSLLRHTGERTRKSTLAAPRC
jgi:hypothetical protein